MNQVRGLEKKEKKKGSYSFSSLRTGGRERGHGPGGGKKGETSSVRLRAL